LCTQLSALNVDFSSPSQNLSGSRRPAQAGVKERPPLISGYLGLSVVGLPSVKIVAHRHKHAAYHNKYLLATSFLGMSTSMTLNDLES